MNVPPSRLLQMAAEQPRLGRLAGSVTAFKYDQLAVHGPLILSESPGVNQPGDEVHQQKEES